MRLLWLTGMIIFALFCSRVSYAQEIEVSTDKQAYSPAEEIKITVKNISSRSVFCSAAGAKPDLAISNVERKLSQWSWDAFRLHCPPQECEPVSGDLKEIKAGKSVNFEWKPQVYSEKKYVVPQPGLWRMTFIYQFRRDNDPKKLAWKTVKSNEFTLGKAE